MNSKVGTGALPDPEKVRESLKDLQFYALCPNGERIPVNKVCEKEGNALRTFDDRLVLVIQAVFPASNVGAGSGASNERVYWNQAFYLSTGESSNMSGTWLPFDGIVLKEAYEAPSVTAKPLDMSMPAGIGLGMGSMGMGMGLGMGMPMPPTPKKIGLAALAGKQTTKGGGVRAWFSKQSFAGPDKNSNKSKNTTNLSTLTPEQKQNVLLASIYGSGLYLPEGDYLFGRYAFRRFGTLSFALASHAIGGNFFADGIGGESLYAPRNNKGMNPIDKGYKELLNTPSPLQACFTFLSKESLITKAYLVNKYIEDNKAFSYMNMFREEGIFPLGLSAFAVSITNLQPAENKLPLETPVDDYLGNLHTVWREYKLGKKTIDDVKKAVTTTPTLAQKTHELTRKQKEQIQYYTGGTRRRRKTRRKSTR